MSSAAATVPDAPDAAATTSAPARPTAGRLVGVDVLRGLAVLGMFSAHLGGQAESLTDPGGWLIVTHGRSAATFAVLAGVSAALLSGGVRPPASLRGPRVRIAVRAALIGLIGVAMEALGTPVAVILPGYAVMFALLLPVLGLRRRTLLTLAGAALLLGPPLLLAMQDLAWSGGLWPGAELLVGPYYPAAVWIAYLLVGLALGRSDLRSPTVRAWLAWAGAVAVVIGYGTGFLARRLLPADQTWWRGLLDSFPHANTATEVIGNVGVVLLLLTGCLVLAERAPRLVTPFAAVGALALTAYCSHLVAIAVLGDQAVWQPEPLTLPLFIVTALVLCTLWRTFLGRGPLERLLHEASTRAAAAVAPAPTPEPAAAVTRAD